VHGVNLRFLEVERFPNCSVIYAGRSSYPAGKHGGTWVARGLCVRTVGNTFLVTVPLDLTRWLCNFCEELTLLIPPAAR
jgi:hypothetical protein